jgi:excisionase family DNA binding protein
MIQDKDTERPNLDDMPDVMTVAQVAQVLGIGRFAAYEAIRRHQLPAIAIGRQLRISKSAVTAAAGQR